LQPSFLNNQPYQVLNSNGIRKQMILENFSHGIITLEQEKLLMVKVTCAANEIGLSAPPHFSKSSEPPGRQSS